VAQGELQARQVCVVGSANLVESEHTQTPLDKTNPEAVSQVVH
jgi:hypothetical protein